MTEEQKQREAEAIEMMHEQWAAPVAGADDDDEPMTWDAPTPAADELARLRARVEHLELQLAAVPVGAIAALYDACPYDQSGAMDETFNAVADWLETRKGLQP